MRNLAQKLLENLQDMVFAISLDELSPTRSDIIKSAEGVIEEATGRPFVFGGPVQLKNPSFLRNSGLTDAEIEANLPESLSDICAVIGVSCVIALIESLGGGRIFVPKNISSGGSKIVKAIGHEAAQNLSHVYAGETVTLPTCAKLKLLIKKRCVIAAYDSGESVNDLATQYGLSVRSIFKYLGEPCL